MASNVYCNFLQDGSEFLPVVLSHLIIKKIDSLFFKYSKIVCRVLVKLKVTFQCNISFFLTIIIILQVCLVVLLWIQRGKI